MTARRDADHHTASARSGISAPQIPDPAVLELARAIARGLARYEYSQRRATKSANSEPDPKEQIEK